MLHNETRNLLILQIAISVFSRFLMTQEMQIILVVFDKKAFQLSRQMVGEIDSYIDANYVKEYQKSGYPGKTFGNRRGHYEREEDHRKRGKKNESSTTSQNNQNTHPGNPNSRGFSMPKCIPILQNKSFHPTPYMLK